MRLQANLDKVWTCAEVMTSSRQRVRTPSGDHDLSVLRRPLTIFPGTLIIGDNEGGNNDYCPEESGSFGGRPWRRGSTLDGRCGVFPRDICWTPDTAAYLVPQAKGSKSGVEKYAQVVHSMTALLDEEIDLVRGQMVRITEIIDKDWYRYGGLKIL